MFCYKFNIKIYGILGDILKDAYYFSHDSNSRYDPKILSMISVYGMQGYGWFWVIIEILREQDKCKFDIQKPHNYNAIALQCQSDCKTIKKYINTCINDFELLKTDGKYIWSESLLKRMFLADLKSKKMRENALKRWDKKNKCQEVVY